MLQVCHVLSKRITVDEDIIEVDGTELVNERSKNDVHKPLEGARCIAQSKRHYSKLI
jgi:hypothetical protein